VLGKREAAKAHALHAKLYKTVGDEDNEGDDEGTDDEGMHEDGVDGEEYEELQMEDEREEIEGDEDGGQEEKVTPKKRRPRVDYISKELRATRRYFNWQIKHDKTISLGEARTFLSQHPIDRNEKHQDKMKQLGKKAK